MAVAVIIIITVTANVQWQETLSDYAVKYVNGWN